LLALRPVTAIVRRLKALAMEELPLRDVPQELREEIAKYISDFVVGFVKFRDTDLDQDADLRGSGTLVQIDGVYGILTACHVLVIIRILNRCSKR
jgi:hypothetical protein